MWEKDGVEPLGLAPEHHMKTFFRILNRAIDALVLNFLEGTAHH